MILQTRTLTHLDTLEAEGIHILREVAGQCRNPALLFSGGKDSACLLAPGGEGLPARPLPLPAPAHRHRAQFPGGDRVPGPAGPGTGGAAHRAHGGRSPSAGAAWCCATPASPATRSRASPCWTPSGSSGSTPASAAPAGTRRRPGPRSGCSRFRDEFGQWDPKRQRPELWDLYNARCLPGENIRVFPISNWTELDVWQYIQREALELPSIYFAHTRRGGAPGLGPGAGHRPHAAPGGGTGGEPAVRFRTVGDIPCTAPVASQAAGLADIIRETATAELTERGATRLDDQTSRSRHGTAQEGGLFLMTTHASSRHPRRRPAALHHLRQRRRRQEHPHRPAAVRQQGHPGRRPGRPGPQRRSGARPEDGPRACSPTASRPSGNRASPSTWPTATSPPAPAGSSWATPRATSSTPATW